MEKKQISCDQTLWFVAQNLKTDSQLFYTIDNKQFHHQCRVAELHGRRIQGYFHGWLILSDHSDGILWSIWNPPTRKLIRLPPLITKETDNYYECCLSSAPGDQGSVLLLFSATTPTLYFCLLGPKSKRKRLKWTKTSYAKQLQSISVEYDGYILHHPASCNGKVYAAVLGWYKVVIHVNIVVNGKEVVISLLPFVNMCGNGPWSRCPSLNNIMSSYNFLKGHCTDLYTIEVGFNDRTRKRIAEVNLYKLDTTTTSLKWKEIVDLENALFFVELASGYFTCYYNSAVDSKLGGYIHILGECGKVIYSFHVKDRTMSLSSLSCPVTTEHEAAAWAMLEWRYRSEVDHPKENEGKDTKIVVRSPVKSEFDSKIVESHLLNMPLVILELIMELCIGVEYMNFRATCKHCCLVAPSIQWSNNTKIRGYSLVSPWLMVLDNYQDIITFIDPLFGDRYFIKTPQELKRGYEIHCSKYGWLLMCENKGTHRMVFFNPFTSDIRELPHLRCHVESFCFSAPPTSPDCMVVGFTKHGSSNVYIHFVSGGSRWHTHNLSCSPYSSQFRVDPYSFHFLTFNGRYIYALCDSGRIEAFKDMTHNGYDWMLVANEDPSRYQTHYMSSCDQHLLLVLVGEFGGSVEVFKVNASTQELERIDNLGKHMIYICNTSCFCLEAKSPEMGNKIYFPRLLHDDNTKIVFYSLETCRFHTFDNKKIQESSGADLFGTKQLCHPHAWIEPSWS